MIAENQSNISSKESVNITHSMPLDLLIYGSIFYTTIFLVGAIGNFLVLFVLSKHKELRNFTNYLLANLSIADLMVIFTNIPNGLHDLVAKERWYLGKSLCHSVSFIENSMLSASILTIFCITCDRYYVICKPLYVKSIMTKKRTLKLIISLWIVSFLVNSPYIYFSQHIEQEFNDGSKEYTCNLKYSTIFYYYIIVTYFLVYFLIGFILMFMYYRIYYFLNKSNEFLIACSQRYNSQKYRNHVSSMSSDIIINNIGKKIKKNLSVSKLTDWLAYGNEFHTNALSCKASNSNFVFLKSENYVHETIILNRCNKFEKYIQQRRKIIGMLIISVKKKYNNELINSPPENVQILQDIERIENLLGGSVENEIQNSDNLNDEISEEEINDMLDEVIDDTIINKVFDATCNANLQETVEKTAQQHIQKLGEAKVGDTVQLPVPEEDRGPADPQNIFAYILKISEKNMNYKLATKHGIIVGWFSRNLFSICNSNAAIRASFKIPYDTPSSQLNSIAQIPSINERMSDPNEAYILNSILNENPLFDKEYEEYESLNNHYKRIY
ncbi:unnamed protein product [Brachionus calyciflorus]|uniref:G-protein coupled receptors family 1 profile domain-containing protein n=1 Tax=Brachionus calyciflorus TaxID=104777 RepID=A0A813V4J6_9BILA|nr:unnamed protein product [Brachionus calyciflorus]